MELRMPQFSWMVVGSKFRATLMAILLDQQLSIMWNQEWNVTKRKSLVQLCKLSEWTIFKTPLTSLTTINGEMVQLSSQETATLHANSKLKSMLVKSELICRFLSHYQCSHLQVIRPPCGALQISMERVQSPSTPSGRLWQLAGKKKVNKPKN